MTSRAAAQIKRVDPNATGSPIDGSTWDRAYRSLQSALASSVNGDEFWVARATYNPGTLQSSSFVLPSQVSLYGGFQGLADPNGGETFRDARPYPPTGTILSGDIDGVPGASQGDCEHVVTFPPGSDGIVLDGFTIRHGYADNTTQPNGAGILMDGTSATIGPDILISQCRIRNNWASKRGGGMYASFATFGMRFCTIRNNDTGVNSVNIGVGGGLSLVKTSGVRIFSTQFVSNRAFWGGGALSVEETVNALLLYSCELRNNFAHLGGALYVDASPASSSVGGTYGNCTFTANEATQLFGTPPVAGEGGAIYANLSHDNAVMTLYNSIVWGNSNVTGTGTFEVSSIQGPTSDIFNTNKFRVNNSDIDWTPAPLQPWPASTGSGPDDVNILMDPLFESPSTSDYRLQAGSPCLERGRDNALGSVPGIPQDFLDLDDNPATTITPFELVRYRRREFQDPNTTGNPNHEGGATTGIVDLGCFERQ